MPPEILCALGDLAANVVLRAVGVKRDVGSVEGDEQFGLVGVQPGKRAVESREFGRRQVTADVLADRAGDC